MNNKTTDLIELKIGILGGGQLGRMLALDWARLGVQPYILDSDPSYPAAQVCSRFIEGSFLSENDVLSFGNDLDILTIEIENVNTSALQKLEKMGKKVFPQPHVIALIQDKGLQKQFYSDHNIATSTFLIFQNKNDIIAALHCGDLHLPCVQKLRKGGYDGKGVQVLRTIEDLDEIWDAPSVIEELVDIEKEIAIVIGRNVSGEMKVYDPVEMVFEPKGNVLDYQFAPARIPSYIADESRKIAEKLAEKLGIVGVLAVEFFISKGGHILVNEMAPRTHNSGHHTLDTCRCSQFEMQLRAIADLPLGDTHLSSPSFMVNILGGGDTSGEAHIEGLDSVLEMPEAKVHLYGKTVSKPMRKMGHVNILSDDVNKVKFVKEKLKIYGN